MQGSPPWSALIRLSREASSAAAPAQFPSHLALQVKCFDNVMLIWRVQKETAIQSLRVGRERRRALCFSCSCWRRYRGRAFIQEAASFLVLMGVVCVTSVFLDANELRMQIHKSNAVFPLYFCQPARLTGRITRLMELHCLKIELRCLFQPFSCHLLKRHRLRWH